MKKTISKEQRGRYLNMSCWLVIPFMLGIIFCGVFLSSKDYSNSIIAIVISAISLFIGIKLAIDFDIEKFVETC